MKKILALTMCTALAMFALTGCGGDKNDTTKDTAAQGDSIKIGINYELSGAVATYGQDSVNGITMAIDEINAAGGIDGSQVELVKLDNKSETSEATSVSTKLVTKNDVVAILGPATSGNFKATIPVAQSNQVPIISASATADDATNKDGKPYEYVFKTCFSDSYQGASMATYAATNLNAKNAVIIQDTSSDYAKGLAENFKKSFESDGGKVIKTAGYIAGDTDFNAVLTSVKDLKFDVIYLPGYYSEVGLIIKQARNIGITAPFLGGDGYDSPTLLELAGASALNDVYYTNHYSSADKDEKVVKFQADFQSKFGSKPSAFNALGYDLGNFIADAIIRAESSNPVDIQKALAETNNFVGVTGSLSIDEKHNAVKTIVVIGLKDGVETTTDKVLAAAE